MENSDSKYFTFIAMLFVALLLTANVIGEKPLLLGFCILPAGLLLFPITYLLGDVLTEVYGFSKARSVIWMGLFCNLLMAFMFQVVIHFPVAETWEYTDAYAQILGSASRMMVISILTYLVGEFINAYCVAILKVKMQGRLFWLRALCASWIGIGIETALFVPLAFYGKLPNDQLITVAFSFYLFKISYALCAMPLASKLVTFLKEKENREIQVSSQSFL